MTDVHDKATRSYNMSKIRGKDTKPEILVRKFLFSNGLRYRLHKKDLPGKPDLVFNKYKAVVFVNGCFWHGHEGCKYFVYPKARKDWWRNKINKTSETDKKNKAILEETGWRVFVVWECELRRERKDTTLIDLLEKIKCI